MPKTTTPIIVPIKHFILLSQYVSPFIVIALVNNDPSLLFILFKFITYRFYFIWTLSSNNTFL